MLLGLVPTLLGLPNAQVYHWNTLGLVQGETQSIALELAELGAKHVVTAVVQLPNVDPRKKSQFQSIGLVGLTVEDTRRMNSLLKELGELGADASINLAQSAGNIALDAGLGTRRAAQIAKIVKLVPLLKDLVELGSDSTSNQRPLEVLGSLGLDLDSGLAFLRQNNLGIADGLRLLSTIANNDGGASLKSLSDINQLLGNGSLPTGATGSPASIRSLETPELRAQLERTNDILTELAELGATYVVSAVADLPGLSPEKKRLYKSIDGIGPVEEARLSSLLGELGKLGAEASIAVVQAGAQVPGIATLAKLVPVLTGLAKLSSVSNIEESKANQAATRAVYRPFGSLPFSGFAPPSPAAGNRILTPELRALSDKTIALVTELAELGAKYVVSAVADLPNVDYKRQSLFQEVGLAGITSREKARLNTVLLELGELGSDASIAVAAAAANIAGTPGVSHQGAAQIAKFAELVPILQGLASVARDTASKSKSSGIIPHLFGVGPISPGFASAIRSMQTPELQAQLDKTNQLLTELAELGAVYVVSAVAELPTISLEKRTRFQKVGTVGEREKARLNALLIELGELGSKASIAVAKVGAQVPGLARLAKLVPVLTTLAELSLVSNSEEAKENLEATQNVFLLPVPQNLGPCTAQTCVVDPRFGHPAIPGPFPLVPFVHF